MHVYIDHKCLGNSKNPKESLNTFGAKITRKGSLQRQTLCPVSTNSLMSSPSEVYNLLKIKRTNNEYFKMLKVIV